MGQIRSAEAKQSLATVKALHSDFVFIKRMYSVPVLSRNVQKGDKKRTTKKKKIRFTPVFSERNEFPKKFKSDKKGTSRHFCNRLLMPFAFARRLELGRFG